MIDDILKKYNVTIAEGGEDYIIINTENINVPFNNFMELLKLKYSFNVSSPSPFRYRLNF